MVEEDCQLFEQIDIRVTAVETSLGHTDIEIRDTKLTFKDLNRQMAEIKADIAAGKAHNKTEDNHFKVRFLTERNEELQHQVQELKSQLQENSMTMKVKKSVSEVQKQKIKDLEFQIEQLHKGCGRRFSFHNTADENDAIQIQSESITQSPVVEQGVKALQDELKHLKERNTILQYEIDSLRGKLHDLGSQSKQQERENEIHNLKSRNCILEAMLESVQSNEKLLKKEVAESLAKRDREKEKIRAIEYQLDKFIADSKNVDT